MAIKQKKTKSKASEQAQQKQSASFAERLVLARWFFSLFGAADFDDLTGEMKDFRLESYDESGVSPYLSILKTRLTQNDLITGDMLLHFDNNIFRFTREINAKREEKVQWKYFQYLTLLFTEIYLYLYFTDCESLLSDLNNYRETINSALPEKEHILPFEKKDMNKLAFWNATGSGKTLIMHINIKQYMHYYNKHNKDELKSVILLTPNAGLSQQHYNELKASSMAADYFDKDILAMNRANRIAILDIYKLEDQEGRTTISAESLEGNNLVLVDEGHRGSSGEKWISLRNQICENGFSFEYSATFGQAVGSSFKADNTLYQLYSKCIIFDYSYKYFYKDGYGKDYQILNMPDKTDRDKKFKYLCAALLSFFQQKILYENEKDSLEIFNIENPLMVFVGSSVIGKKAGSQKEKDTISDVGDILLFFDKFMHDSEKSVTTIDTLLSGDTGLVDSRKNDIFGHSFIYLKSRKYNGKKAYSEMLKLVFNSSGKSGRLHVENLRGVPGEVGIRAGNNDYFGVINIGEDTGFLKICEDNGMLTGTRDFTESLFHRINTHDSKINILVGSKKFTEGWNSWRVSTMGLINVGQSEGTQIIQLFGRGVRLKGLKHSLMRSSRLHPVQLDTYIPSENIHLSETLNIFGVRADYIQKFKEMLEREGVPDKEKNVFLTLNVKQDIKTDRIKMLHLKSEADFQYKAPVAKIGMPPVSIKSRNIVLNWYPKIDTYHSEEMFSFTSTAQLNQGFFTEGHIPFIDFDSIYFELNSYKRERDISNLILEKDVLPGLLLDNTWYTLLIPAEEINTGNLEKIQSWNDIALILLKKYIYRFYHHERGRYEKDKREYISLAKYEAELAGASSKVNDDNPGNLINRYTFEVPEDETGFIEYINDINEKIKKRDYGSIEKNLYADPLLFSRHLYKPLLYMNSSIKQLDLEIKVTPESLEDSEYHFVKDLCAYYEMDRDVITGKELYLLRNRGRGRGFGFFEADNFYPDFIMWLIDDDKQYISFLDPKGLVHINQAHPKIQFSSTVKSIEKEMGDDSVILNSFILSYTPYQNIRAIWNNLSKEEVEKLNVLFMIDDRDNFVYIDKLFHMILDLPYSGESRQLEFSNDNIVFIPDYEKSAYKDALPLYSLKAVCGKFGNGEAVEPEGWVAVPEKKGMSEGWFVAQATGKSMEPRISDGDYCIFRPVPAGTKEGRVLLVQHRSVEDPETGGAYTIKRYTRAVELDENGEERKRIVLEPLNRDFEPIVLEAEDEDVMVVGEFVGVI